MQPDLSSWLGHGAWRRTKPQPNAQFGTLGAVDVRIRIHPPFVQAEPPVPSGGISVVNRGQRQPGCRSSGARLVVQPLPMAGKGKCHCVLGCIGGNPSKPFEAEPPALAFYVNRVQSDGKNIGPPRFFHIQPPGHPDTRLDLCGSPAVSFKGQGLNVSPSRHRRHSLFSAFHGT